jgi:cellulose biosynthesis protein BcsQ
MRRSHRIDGQKIERRRTIDQHISEVVGAGNAARVQRRDRFAKAERAVARLADLKLKTVDQVKTTLNPKLSIHGIVLTMFDARNNLANQVVADVRQFMGRKVYDTIIPRNVRVSEAPSYGKPVLVYDLKCVGSEAYLRLATEIIQREKELRAS